MKVISKGIKDGYILDKYGMRGKQRIDDIPSCSIPFEVMDAPENTVSYALILEDKDAYSVTEGSVWIHWLAANILTDKMEENASRTRNDIVQGCNSWWQIIGKEKSSFYGGMTPPDAPHRYELHVYALDKKLDIQNGFPLNKLWWEMRDHILDKQTIVGIYNN